MARYLDFRLVLQHSHGLAPRSLLTVTFHFLRIPFVMVACERFVRIRPASPL